MAKVMVEKLRQEVDPLVCFFIIVFSNTNKESTKLITESTPCIMLNKAYTEVGDVTAESRILASFVIRLAKRAACVPLLLKVFSLAAFN